MGQYTKDVTDAQFQNTVADNKMVLVDFWAEWCPPCRAIAPTLEEIGQELGSKILIAKVNVDENPSTPAQFGVRGIPTLILFKDGKEVEQLVGKRSKDDLLATIAKHS